MWSDYRCMTVLYSVQDCVVIYVWRNLFLVSFFFFKQKTAYEMRISDWSSDVCSSDLGGVPGDLGKAIDPARCDAVGGRGVDHPRPVVGDHRHRLARGIVGQAEDDEIGVVQRLGAPRGVLALGVGQGDERELAASGEPLGDFEPRGSGCPVDENCLYHRSEEQTSEL